LILQKVLARILQNQEREAILLPMGSARCVSKQPEALACHQTAQEDAMRYRIVSVMGRRFPSLIARS
jgi:hypothetical protein